MGVFGHLIQPAGDGGFDLAIEPVVGYRWWVLPRLVPESLGAPLLGATGEQAWLPGVNEARCNFHAAHYPPAERCGCGFWAYWKHAAHDLGGGVPVTGAIEGTGRTLNYEFGFRCQQARITALHVPADGVLKPLLAAAERLCSPPAPASTRVNVGGAHLEPGGIEVFKAITGHDPRLPRFCIPEAERARMRDAVVQEAMERLTGIEMLLEQAYPEAEICTTLPYLLLKHPPSGQPLAAASNPCGTPHCHYTGPATISHCECPQCHGR